MFQTQKLYTKHIRVGKFMFFILFLFSGFNSSAQSTSEVNKQAIITDARKQLVAMSSLNGKLSDFAIKNNITGEFVVDFTITGKGKILTVFMVSSNPDVTAIQNMVKSKLTEIQFDNIKIPKKERIKFRHTLTF